MVVDRRCDQESKAVLGYLDSPGVHDERRFGTLDLFEPEGAVHEVRVVNVQRRGQQTGDVDTRTRAEENSARIDDEDAAVRFELAQDLARIAAQDTIQRDRPRTWLHELHQLICANIKALPADNGLVGYLVDGRDRCLPCNGGLPRRYLASLWSSPKVGAKDQKPREKTGDDRTHGIAFRDLH